MEKVIKDGKVAVLVSRGFGAGWWTWNKSATTPFEPKVVEMVLANKQEQITDEWCLEHLGVDIYAGGAHKLEVIWLDEGTRFSIDEYDGSESITTVEDLPLVA